MKEVFAAKEESRQEDCQSAAISRTVGRGVLNMFDRKSFIDRVLPKNPWDWALYVFVIICAIRPWVVLAILFPHDPVAVQVIYRSPLGDIEYFPMINALAAGNIGEDAVYESWGKYVESFPVASLFPHVLGTALFGPYWGYLLADVAVALVFFVLFRAWCRQFSASDGWASFIAAVFVSGLPDIYVNLGQIWGQRLPRPFVTDLFFIAGIMLFVWMLAKKERLGEMLPWFGVGVVMSLCLQSYVYFMPVLGLAAGYVFLTWLVTDREAIRRASGRIGVAVLAFVILSVPFFLQRAFESADEAGRIGIFKVDRLAIWANPIWRDTHGAFQLGMYTLMLLCFFNLIAMRFRRPMISWHILGLLAVLQVGAFLAMPLSTTLAGKLVQPYHFLGLSRSVQACLLVALVSFVGGGIMPRMIGARLLAVVLLAGSFCVVMNREVEADRAIGHLRPDIYTPPGPDYRQAFVNLVRELDKEGYKDDRVMATTDAQVYFYWVGFHHGFAFFPDCFSTAISNRQIEDRVLWFAREEGLDKDSLARFLNQKAVLMSWLESDRFQCSPLYQKAPLSDYAPEDIARNFDNPPDMGSFALALPKSDIRRLQDRYAEIRAMPESSKPRLDLIILGTDLVHFPLPPPDPSHYRLAYRDAYFQVWKAIGASGS